jgi:hypothetical protein
MSRIAGLLVATTIASGCGAPGRQYSLGRAVTSVQLAGDKLQVTSCDLTVTEEGSEGDAALAVLFILLLPLLLFGGGRGFGGGDSGPTLTAEQCAPRTVVVVENVLPVGGAR